MIFSELHKTDIFTDMHDKRRKKENWLGFHRSDAAAVQGLANQCWAPTGVTLCTYIGILVHAGLYKWIKAIQVLVYFQQEWQNSKLSFQLFLEARYNFPVVT